MMQGYILLWSELRSILDSVYGKATTIVSFASPFVYLYFLPEEIIGTVKITAAGALLVVFSNVFFMSFVPSVQRHYPRYVDYEDKCLKLENEHSLDLYEEFGSVVGWKVNKKAWLKSGLSFGYLEGEDTVPSIDDYKKHFKRSKGDQSEINRRSLSRSLSAIKYVAYDSSKELYRFIVTLTLFVGISLIYVPIFFRLAGWISK